MMPHDAREILRNLRKSFKWAMLDMVCRYRRSHIGPFWETLNVMVLILGMTLVASAVLSRGTVLGNMAYIGLGIIVWSAIATSITEGSSIFPRHSEFIRGTSMSIDLYVGRTVFGIFLTFCHHLVLYAIGLLFLPIELKWLNLLAIPGIFLFFINALWVVPTLGFICARYRDVEQIVRNLVQLAFFVTPIFWNYNLIDSDKSFIVTYNPLFYFLHIVRGPLLGDIPHPTHYLVVLTITVLGFALLFFAYQRMRRNLALYV